VSAMSSGVARYVRGADDEPNQCAISFNPQARLTEASGRDVGRASIGRLRRYSFSFFQIAATFFVARECRNGSMACSTSSSESVKARVVTSRQVVYESELVILV